MYLSLSLSFALSLSLSLFAFVSQTFPSLFFFSLSLSLSIFLVPIFLSLSISLSLPSPLIQFFSATFLHFPKHSPFFCFSLSFVRPITLFSHLPLYHFIIHFCHSSCTTFLLSIYIHIDTYLPASLSLPFPSCFTIILVFSPFSHFCFIQIFPFVFPLRSRPPSPRWVSKQYSRPLCFKSSFLQLNFA